MGKKGQAVFANLEKWLSYIFFIVMAVAVLLQLVSRLWGTPLSWGEEVARFAYVWSAFVGASYVTLRRDHIQISFFVNQFPRKAQRVIQILQNILMIVCVVWILPSAFSHSVEQYANLSPALEMPIFYVYISFPIGMSLLLLRLIQLLMVDFKSFKIS